jgi:hypothetical protein
VAAFGGIDDPQICSTPSAPGGLGAESRDRMIHYADPPILLRDVLDDVHAAEVLLARVAPYTPLGGWYRPDADPDAATNPLWF